MAENGNTAEHELLRAIEGDTVSIAPKKSKPDTVPITEKVTSMIERVGKGLSDIDLHEKLSLRTLSGGLLALLAAVVGLSLIISARGIIKLNNIPRFELSSMKKPVGGSKVSFPLKEYAHYMDSMLGRNIFKPAAEDKQEKETILTGVQSMAESLKLVGISWSKDPRDRFAMIEDTKVNLTYYVQEGDTVGPFRVDRINEDRIVLVHGENEVELR